MVPKTALEVHEESWNAYPRTKTKFSVPFVEKFTLEIDTVFQQDSGKQVRREGGREGGRGEGGREEGGREGEREGGREGEREGGRERWCAHGAGIAVEPELSNGDCRPGFCG